MKKNIKNFEVHVGDIALTKVTRNKVPYIEVALLENPNLRALYTFEPNCTLVESSIPEELVPTVTFKVRMNTEFVGVPTVSKERIECAALTVFNRARLKTKSETYTVTLKKLQKLEKMKFDYVAQLKIADELYKNPYIIAVELSEIGFTVTLNIKICPHLIY